MEAGRIGNGRTQARKVFRRLGSGQVDFGGRRTIVRLKAACLLGTGRIDFTDLKHFQRQMARPAGAIPSGQRAAGLAVVEDDFLVGTVDRLVQIIQRIIRDIIEIHHEHVGTYFLEQRTAEARHGTFVHDARAAFVQASRR